MSVPPVTQASLMTDNADVSLPSAAFQGGFIPDIILYLSYYYNTHDLPVRMAFFYTMNYFAAMVSNFLSVGLLEMRGVAGQAGWKWLFLVE